MSTEVDDAEESLLKLEAPKISINLGKVLGFAPIQLEIPLPKIRNPFSAVQSRPLTLPFKRIEVRLRAWWDALGSIPRFDGETRSAIELEMVRAAEDKVRGIEFALAPRKLEIDLALNELQPYRIKSDAAVNAAKNECAAALASFADRMRRVEAWVERCEKRVAEARLALTQFVKGRGLLSDKPYSVLRRKQNVIAVVVLYFVDLFMSVPLVQADESFSLVNAIWVSAAFSLMNCVIGLAGGQFVAHLYFRKLASEFQALQKAFLVAWAVAGVLINVLFAIVRDQHTGTFTPMGGALVVVGLALFVIFGVKGFKDFADVHSGHMDLWTDLQNALSKLGKANGARVSLNAKRHETRAAVHSQVREGVESYMSAIGRTRKGAADCRSALEAQLDLVPSLGKGFHDTATTLIALYRECNAYWRRKREPAPAAVPNPVFEDAKYSVAREIAKIVSFDSILSANEQELQSFAQRFEDYVAQVLGTNDDGPDRPADPGHGPHPGDGMGGSAFNGSGGRPRSANGGAPA